MSYEEVLREVINNPETMDTINAHVANGGSILELCATWGVRFSDIHRWINDDQIRSKSYDQAMSQQNEWVIQRILQEVRRLAFMDIRSLFNDDGTAKPMKEWSEDAAKSVIGMKHTDPKIDKDGEILVPEIREIKLEKKIDAIKLLGNCKELRLFADRIEHNAGASLLDLIEGSLSVKEKIPQASKDEDNI